MPGSLEQKIKSAFLTNRRTDIGQWLRPPAHSTAFYGLHHSDWPIGGILPTVSYYPQLKKCWATGSAGDLSLKMFITLSAGIGLWVVYGFLKNDFVIIIANAVSLALLMGICDGKGFDQALSWR